MNPIIHFPFNPDLFIGYTMIASGFAVALVFGVATIINVIVEKVSKR